MKYFVITGIIFLFITNILLLFLLKQKDTATNIPSEVDFLKLKKLEKEYAFTMEHNLEQFPLDLLLVTLDGKHIRLQDTLKSTAFVMWYPQHNCMLCFRRNLDLFLEVAQNNANAIILSTKMNVRDLFFFKKKYNISTPCFAVEDEEKEYPFKKYTSPLFFNLSTQGVVDRLLIHNPDFETISNRYFNMQKKLCQP